MDEEGLISRNEVTAYLFTVQDIYEDLHQVRRLLEEDDDGEAPEDDA